MFLIINGKNLRAFSMKITYFLGYIVTFYHDLLGSEKFIN